MMMKEAKNKKATTPSSFLSYSVKYLLHDIGANIQGSRHSSYNQYFTQNNTYNWKEVSTLIGKIPDDFNILEQESAWFERIIFKLWPLFEATMAVLKEAGPIALQQFWDLCKWTNKEQEIKEQYSVLLGGSPTAVLEAMLFLTALIEHSLGKIVFMQVLIGTPLGMNLRNIVWHGFPRPEEIKDHFVTTLLITVASIGELLETQGVDICQLPNRTPVVNLPECAEVLAGCFPNIHDYQEQVLELNQPHSTTWDAILQHYIERRYGTSLALVLPHLEQLLRVIFCTVNNCQVRLLTAETTAFYTTLDEILAPTIVGAGGTVVNNMRSLLGDSIIELLEDMLTHQAGPRVRDKLSHGECDLLNIPPALTNHVICVALALMCRVNQILHQTNTYHLGKEELPDYLSDLLFNLQNAHTNDACKELCDKILSASTSYVSKFHPTALLRRDIVSVIKKLKFLKEVPQPEEALFLYNYSKDSLVCKDLLGFHNELYLTLKAFGNLDEVFSCEVLVKFVESMSVSTVYRPKLEGEVVSILRRIIDHAAIVSSQVKEVLCTKFLLYTNHKLRSRQRKTYHYMLNTAPSFSVALYCIVMVVIIQMFKLNIPQKSNYHHLSRYDILYMVRHLS